MNDQKIKQQIVEKLKSASNILITVSSSPSVDELSAALGLTLLVNKMDKHGTAIFSGSVPPAITFLEPDKTFEDTTDSLRDFIIALDKEKADHLRYKLEGDLVKIYITPYRSTITSDDLEFSQGDYNVELVIALGVENKDHLDEALAGHGKILHDATVVTITAGEQTSNLGSIDWHDDNASSLSEMLVTLYDALKLDKSLMDKSIATAYLTGIVSATERFSNTRTSSRVMTVAAQLMAAGADQQLIAAQLATGSVTTEVDEPAALQDVSPEVEEPEEAPKTTEAPEPAKKSGNGELSINHEKKGTLDEVAHEVATEQLEASAKAAERALEEQIEQQQAQAQAATSSIPEPQSAPVPPLPVQPRGAVSYTPTAPAALPVQSPLPVQEQMEQEPLLGGTLNATTEQAEDDKRREIENDKNKVILSHNYIGNQQPTYDAPINSATETDDGPAVDIFSQSDSMPSAESQFEPVSAPTVSAAPLQPPVVDTPQPVADPYAGSVPTLADIDAQNRTPSTTDPHADARAAIDAAFNASSASSASTSSPSAALPPLPQAPSLPDMNGLPLPPPLPPLPPELSALPPLPGQTPERLGDILTTPSVDLPQIPVVQSPSDPAQFRIPGQ